MDTIVFNVNDDQLDLPNPLTLKDLMARSLAEKRSNTFMLPEAPSSNTIDSASVPEHEDTEMEVYIYICHY